MPNARKTHRFDDILDVDAYTHKMMIIGPSCLHSRISIVVRRFKRVPGPRLNIKTIFPRYGDSHV